MISRVCESFMCVFVRLSFVLVFKMSSIGDLYGYIIHTDETCVNFLNQKGVLPKGEN